MESLVLQSPYVMALQEIYPTEMGDQLSIIITSGNRLTNLINDILDFSKLKHNSLDVHLKPVYLSGIVDVVFTICQPLVKNKSLSLINNIDDSLPSVVADQNRLQQILYNLIGNSIKYTDYWRSSHFSREFW